MQLPSEANTRFANARLPKSTNPRSLFPGGQPGRPISVQLATELPAAVLARTLGIDITVAVKWQRAAASDWGAYAADVSRRFQRSVQEDPSEGHPRKNQSVRSPRRSMQSS